MAPCSPQEQWRPLLASWPKNWALKTSSQDQDALLTPSVQYLHPNHCADLWIQSERVFLTRQWLQHVYHTVSQSWSTGPPALPAPNHMIYMMSSSSSLCRTLIMTSSLSCLQQEDLWNQQDRRGGGLSTRVQKHFWRLSDLQLASWLASATTLSLFHLNMKRQTHVM